METTTTTDTNRYEVEVRSNIERTYAFDTALDAATYGEGMVRDALRFCPANDLVDVRILDVTFRVHNDGRQVRLFTFRDGDREVRPVYNLRRFR
jgi:hypothetical protein